METMRHTALSVVAAGLLAVSALAAPRLDMLVSTDWLASHLKDRKLVVLHVARERAHYDVGHIPGACYVPWNELTVSRDGIPVELPPVAELVTLFERCGVNQNSRIILYGDYLGLSASRAYFTLDYLGLGAQAALLDGGFEKWRAEQRPVSRQEPPARHGKFRPPIQPEVLIALNQVRDLSWQAVHAPSPDALLIDVRAPADFARGHIPGAVNLYWPRTLTSKEMPTLRPMAEVDRMYRAVGVVPGHTSVVYCGVGVQAAQAYFTLKYLGYDVRLFDGSMVEWNRATAAPAK
jgi:thiosulfate/3-mercaptopyruvate sulfurtransferase